MKMALKFSLSLVMLLSLCLTASPQTSTAQTTSNQDPTTQSISNTATDTTTAQLTPQTIATTTFTSTTPTDTTTAQSTPQTNATTTSTSTTPTDNTTAQSTPQTIATTTSTSTTPTDNTTAQSTTSTTATGTSTSTTSTDTTTQALPTTTVTSVITSSPSLDIVMYPYGVEALDTKYSRNQWSSWTCPRVEFDFSGVPFFGRKHYHVYVCPNGLMSFDSPWLRWWPYNFGQYYWFDRYAMLAPYWALTDIYDSFDNDISQMYYHVYREYDENPSTEGVLQRATNDVNKHTKNNPLPTEFTRATYVLVVTWVRLRHWYSRWMPVMQTKFNTFQAVLVTDGVYSFVLFNYPRNGIQWSVPYDNADYYYLYWYDSALPVVGINAGDTRENYYNHPRSGRVPIVDIDDIEGINAIKPFGVSNFQQTLDEVHGRLFIRLEDSLGGLNAMIECVLWYLRDLSELRFPGLQFYLNELEPCPCTYWQAWRDRRFRFHSGRWPVYCFLSRFPNTPGWGQKCCYEFVRTRGFWWGWWWWFPLLTSGFPKGGNAQRYHQRGSRNNWLSNDYRAYQQCCIYSNLCWMYQTRRPSDTCARYVPPRWTWFWGDPHFVTLDSKNYTFNGLGEYVMLDAKDGYFQLQARTRLAKGNGTATVFSGAVAKEKNSVTVQVTLPYDNETMEVLVDGKPYDFKSLTNVSVDVSNGSVTISKPEDQCFEMSFPSGMSVTICEKQKILSIVTAAPESFKNETKGLLGTWNGDPNDDFTLPNGTVLPHDMSGRDIHYNFGLLWQVNSNTSLFIYKPGESFSTFVNSSFKPMFIDEIQWANESLRQQALAACNGDVSCLFDIASTGDVSVGQNTRQIGSQLVNDSNRMSNEAPKFSNSSSVIYLSVNTTVTVLINATDDDGDDITFNVSGLPYGTSQSDNPTSVSLTWKVTMEKFELVVLATDSKGASTVFKPTVYVCACHHNGTCEKPSKLGNQTLTDPGKRRFFIMSCACVDGYTGQFCESDIDACEANSNPCYPGVRCTDLPPPANATTGFKCGPCPSGYTGNGANCTDIDECDKAHDCEQICRNTPGSYVCDCRQGYKLNVNKKNCDDINECDPISDCMQNCTNYAGGYACSCNQYFKVDPVDPKKCKAETPCTSNRPGCTQVCYVVDGAEKCACYRGYELADDKKTCKDIDECARNLHRCQQKCTNTVGGYSCSCVKGFELASDNVTCNDINECMRWTFNCSDPSQLCMNTEGSYKCQCQEGLYWIDNKCRALRPDEPTPTPPPAPTPKTPTDNELGNAVIITMDNFDFSKWNKETEDKFKEAVAKAVTEYCANASNDCGAMDPNRVIIYNADQVHLVPDFSAKNPTSLAFYVNYPPGVGQPGKITIHKDTLIKIIRAHQSNIEKSLGNARITDVRPYKEQEPGPKETDYRPIIIGSAVGLVLLLLLVIFVLWWLYRRSPKVAVGGGPLSKEEIGEIKHFPIEELEMQTKIPRAHFN